VIIAFEIRITREGRINSQEFISCRIEDGPLLTKDNLGYLSLGATPT